MNYCPNCGAEVDSAATVCPSCGAALPAEFSRAGDERRPHSGQPSRDERQPRGQRDPQRQPHDQPSRHNQRAPRGQQPPQEPATNERQPPRDSPQPRSAEYGAPRQPSADQRSSGSTRRTLLLSAGGLAALAGGWFFFLREDGGGGLGASTPPLDQMEVRLADVRRPDIGATSATLPFILAFHNPTDRAIPDLSGDFDIYVNGVRVGSDELTVNRLEAGEETMVDLAVIVEYADVSQALIDALRSQSFDVRVEGSINAGGASRAVSIEGQV